MAAFTIRCLVTLLFTLALVPAAYPQSIEDEINTVREAIQNSTNADERQTLTDFLKILEITAARNKPASSARPSSSQIGEAIDHRSLPDFMEAVRAEEPLLPSHLLQVVTDYQKVSANPSSPGAGLSKSVLLSMAEVLLKKEVANTGTRNQMLTTWFECFYILAPAREGDESCSELFEKLLVYMPDELTTYRRPLDGMSLLHLYAFPPVEAYISLMLKLGFDKTLRNTLGQTPLEYLQSEVANLKKAQPDLFLSPAETAARNASNSEEFIANRIRENTRRLEQIEKTTRLLSQP